MKKQDILESPVNYAYLAIGSNLGKKIYNLELAKYKLSKKGIYINKSSSFYVTRSWPNSNYPDFINAVLLVKTKLTLVQLFQEVKKLIPDIKLKVFSCFNRDRSCSLAEAEEKAYKPLERIDELIDFDENGRPVQNHFNMTNNYYSSVYDLLMKDPNVEFYGSVPQKVLFKHIEEAMCLFYPNTFMETCCINALEAMAMRCNVLTSNLGALGETTKMFGSLIDLGIDVDRSPDTHIPNPVRYVDIPETYKRRFVNETVRIIENYWSESNQQLLNEQQNYIEKECFWKSRCKKMLDVL